jgi:uncharacterized protein YdhG (YjbR/CyaY superfamily)
MESKKTTPKNIEEYIANFPENVQAVLQKVRKTIHEAAPDAQETINYQMPTFTLNGNLVHFAAFEKHIGFYPTPSGIEKFRKEIDAYKNAKGSVQFPLDQSIPYELISRITEFRVKEQQAKAKKKK